MAAVPNPSAGLASKSFSPSWGSIAEHLRTVSARVQRRATPANRHRARARAQSGVHHRRRSGLRARRLDPGADRPPDDGVEGAAEADLPVHRPRPAPRGTHLQSGCGDVSGKNRGTRRHAARSSPTPRTPTRARCSAPSRCSIRMRRVSASRSIPQPSIARRPLKEIGPMHWAAVS